MKNIYSKIYQKFRTIHPIRQISIITLILASITMSSLVYAQSIDRAQGTQWAYNMDMPYDVRYEEINQGGIAILRDKLTGLKWEKFPSTSSFSHTSAITHCRSKGSGWRLPNIYELRTIISLNYNRSNTVYSRHPGITNTWYWSSTTYAPDTSRAWYVYFDYGNVTNYYKTNSQRVLCLLD